MCTFIFWILLIQCHFYQHLDQSFENATCSTETVYLLLKFQHSEMIRYFVKRSLQMSKRSQLLLWPSLEKQVNWSMWWGGGSQEVRVMERDCLECSPTLGLGKESLRECTQFYVLLEIWIVELCSGLLQQEPLQISRLRKTQLTQRWVITGLGGISAGPIWKNDKENEGKKHKIQVANTHLLGKCCSKLEAFIMNLKYTYKQTE